MKSEFTREKLTQLVADLFRTKNFTKQTKNELFSIIINDLVNNNVSKKQYKITNHGETKDIIVDCELLSNDALLDILVTLEYVLPN